MKGFLPALGGVTHGSPLVFVWVLVLGNSSTHFQLKNTRISLNLSAETTVLVPAGQNLSKFLNRGCRNQGGGPVNWCTTQPLCHLCPPKCAISKRNVHLRSVVGSIWGISLFHISVQ